MCVCVYYCLRFCSCEDFDVIMEFYCLFFVCWDGGFYSYVFCFVYREFFVYVGVFLGIWDGKIYFNNCNIGVGMLCEIYDIMLVIVLFIDDIVIDLIMFRCFVDVMVILLVVVLEFV